jgi:hypothetical protein
MDIAQALFAEARARLEPQGWKLTLEKASATAFAITFEHELTCPYGVHFDRERPDNQDVLERTLERFEFRAIAERPVQLPHAKLLRSIRQAAMGWRWPPTVIPLMAGILLENDVISDTEAVWLEYAGPSWATEAED